MEVPRLVQQEENPRGDENVDEGDLEKEDPAELHQLVVTEARDRPADQDEEQNEGRRLLPKKHAMWSSPSHSGISPAWLA